MSSLSSFKSTVTNTWNRVTTGNKPTNTAANTPADAVDKSVDHDGSESSSHERELQLEAQKTPKKSAQSGASLPTPVATSPGHGVAPPVVAPQTAPVPQMAPVQPQPLSARERIVSAYADCLADVQGRLERCQSSAPQQVALQHAASAHVDAAIRRLPVAFGLQSDAIENWLTAYAGPADKLACNLLSFLITGLQSKGHGSDAANWLFQQVLTAGSTCLTAQAQDARAQGQYLGATVEELRRVRREFTGSTAVQDLLAGFAKPHNEPLIALRDHVMGKKKATVSELDDASLQDGGSLLHQHAKTGSDPGSVNTASGSNQNTPKAVLVKEPVELDGSSVNITRKKKKKPTKNADDKKPKPGQLSDGDGKPPVGSNKLTSPATKPSKVDTVTNYHANVDRATASAFNTVRHEFDALMAEGQGSSSTGSETPKTQLPSGLNLKHSGGDGNPPTDQ